MTIASIIQSQMLQTLLNALRSSDLALAAGKTLEARFLGWANPSPVSAEPPAGAPALRFADVALGDRRLTLALEVDAAREALLRPGAALTLAVDTSATADAPARARLLAIHPVPQTNGEPLATPAATLAARAAGPLIGAALARQDGLAPLFADLDAILGAQAPLPAAVREHAARALALRLPATEAVTPERLKIAVAGSGIFHEARLASGDADAAAGDLKSALLALKQALRETILPAPSGERQQTAPGQPDRASGPVPQADQARLPGVAGLREAARAYLGLPPETKAADLRDGEAPIRPPASVEAFPRGTRPEAPMRDGAPVAQPAVFSDLDPARDTMQGVLAKVLERTEAALDRMSLSQFAGLPSETAATQPINRWFVELPLALDGRSPVLPLEIEEDHAGPDGVVTASGRLWRVRFALDVEPIGPVHALLTMQARQIAVAVWAEREATSRLVRDHAADLKQALLDGDFNQAEIEVFAGQPSRRAPAAGQYLDRVS